MMLEAEQFEDKSVKMKNWGEKLSHHNFTQCQCVIITTAHLQFEKENSPTQENITLVFSCLGLRRVKCGIVTF